MTKEQYRTFFLCCSDFCKMAYFAQQCNIQPSRLSTFIRGNDWVLSIEKLELLKECILDHFGMICKDFA